MFYGNCQIMQLVNDSSNFIQQTKEDFMMEKNLKTKEIEDLRKKIISLENTLYEIKKTDSEKLNPKNSTSPPNK